MQRSVAKTPVTPEAEALARDIASDLPSPFCPGRSIASCSSSAARVVEREMVQMASEGKTREQIESVLMERFGEEALGSPLRGDLVVGVTLVSLIAVALVWVKARAWVRASAKEGEGGQESAEPSPEISDQDRDRLEAELDKLDA